VPPERIRYWVKRQFINPSTLRGRNFRFAFNDLILMRLAKELLPTRRHLEPIQRCFQRLRSMVGPTRPVHSLKLENLDGHIVMRDGAACFEVESGQLVFDFAPRAKGKVEERFGAARARARFEEARRMAEEDPLKALTIYSDLVSREPVNFDAHMRLAALLEHENDLKSAMRHYLGAAAIVPASAEVHFKLGLLYRKMGGHDAAAIASFNRALECDPTMVEAHRNLAELFDVIGRKRESIKHLSAIHRLIKGD